MQELNVHFKVSKQEKLWTPLKVRRPYREIWIDRPEGCAITTCVKCNESKCRILYLDQVILVICSPSWSSAGIGLVSSTAGSGYLNFRPAAALQAGSVLDFRHAPSSATSLVIWAHPGHTLSGTLGWVMPCQPCYPPAPHPAWSRQPLLSSDAFPESVCTLIRTNIYNLWFSFMSVKD